MKKLLLTITYLSSLLSGNCQIDSVSFTKSSDAEIISINSDEITINKMKVKTGGESTQFLTLGDKCNFILPKYSQLTDGVVNFKKLKTDASGSLSALGSSLSFEKKSEYYIYYLVRSKTFSCPENTDQNKVSYGVGVYVILKISNLKTKVDIKTPYDIAAVGQLGLAKVELDVTHFGMIPALANEFLPSTLGGIDIEAAKYFDRLLENTKTKINDKNTNPTIMPIERM